MSNKTAREEQIARAITDMLASEAEGARSRHWGGHGRPRFTYTTTRVEDGWASYVAFRDLSRHSQPERDQWVIDPASVHIHSQRKAAKARAWNLFQGWLLGEGEKVRWGSFA